jgi:hypothetical protein
MRRIERFCSPLFHIREHKDKSCYSGLKKYVDIIREKKGKGKAVPLQWPRGFQEIKVPILHYNGTGWW